MVEKTQQPTKGDGRPRWIRWGALLFLSCVLFLSMVWAGLQTRWAREGLSAWVRAATQDKDGYRVTLEGLEAGLPFSLRLRRVTLSDGKKTWLEAEDVDISLRPWALLSGILELNWFRVGTLSVLRLPETAGTRAGEESLPPGRPSLPLPRVMVREMMVERMDLGEAVAGVPLAYRLRSRAWTEGSRIELHTLLQDLHHANDPFRLKAAYDLTTEGIEVDLTYHESKGGLAAGLLGLKDSTGIGLSLRLAGPVKGARGRMDLVVGGYGRAGFDLDLGVKEAVSLFLAGGIQAEPSLLPVEVTRALGGAEMDIRCRVDLSREGVAHVRSLEVKAPSCAASVEGTADLVRGRMALEATVSPPNPSSLLAESGLAIEGLGPIQVTAKGDLRRPEITLSTVLREFSAPGAGLKEMTLTARGLFESGYTGLKKGEAWITAKEAMSPHMPKPAGPLSLRVTAAAPDYTHWDVQGLELTAPGVLLSSREARIDTGGGRVFADLLLQVARIAALMPGESQEIDGQVVLRTRLEGNIKTQELHADMDMAFSRLSGLPAPVEGLAGPSPSITARGGVKGGILTVEETLISGRNMELRGEGRLHLADGTYEGEYRLSLPDLSPTDKALGVRVSGRAESKGRISGSVRDASADLTLSSDGVRVNDLNVTDIHAQLAIWGLPDRPQASLALHATALDQPFQLTAALAWAGDTLSISRARAALPGIDLNADLGIGAQAPHIWGKAEVRLASLKLVKALWGLDLAGTGRLQIQGGRSAAKGGLTLDAAFKDLRYEGHTIPRLRIVGQMDDRGEPRGRITLEAKDALFGNLRVKTLQADVTGGPHQAVATLEARGSFMGVAPDGGPSEAPLTVSVGLLVTHDRVWRIRMDRFRFLLGKDAVVLPQPTTLTLNDREITLDDLQLIAGTARLQVQGRLGGDHLQASARIIDIPIEWFSPWLGHAAGGNLSAQCAVSGRLQDPAVRVEMRLRDYRIPLGEGKEDLVVEASLKADRKGDRFEAEMTLAGLDEIPFTATLSLPARFSLRPFAFVFDGDRPLNGLLKGHLDLALLRRLPGMEHQTLSGDVEVDLGIVGSVEAWGLTGGINVLAGLYENPTTGTILSDIHGRLQAEGRSLRWHPLTANDGGAGTVSLEGGIALEAPFPIHADLTFREATLLRKDTLTSTLSGNLGIRGTPKRVELSGEIILDKTDLDIPRRLPPDLVIIPVKEINVPPTTGVKTEAHVSEDSKRLVVDLSIRIPGRFFLKGRGLDAEFKGALTAKGPVDNPMIRGTLEVVRGTFQFMSRTFHITQGQIAFDGSVPPVPLLNATSQASAGQIEAQVGVSGPVDHFSLTLTSQPPLPQDEIMANILFGQSVARLNPFQAYQLAAAISKLSGGGMPDIVGETKGLLGVDRLSISGGDTSKKSERGPALSAGKYVSEGLYVGVEQELTDARQDVVVEVEVTPHFSVESRAGTRSGAGIGFNWKYDY